jgi:hypothetical protein
MVIFKYVQVVNEIWRKNLLLFVITKNQLMIGENIVHINLSSEGNYEVTI